MTPEHLAGLLCHHGADAAGHELGEACPVKVKPSGPALVTWPQIRRYVADGSAPNLRTLGALGTCPECGRDNVRLALRTVRIADSDRHDHLPGVRLADAPTLAPHKRPGLRAPACPGPPLGVWPGPTRYRIPAVEAMVRDYGTDSIA